MSNTVLEAMATGLPVIASRVGGNPEILLEGRTGFLFPPDDVDALDDALRRLIADSEERDRMGHAGRARAVEEFGLERMTERYEQMYLAVAMGNGVVGQR